jgi:hypothetical protein
MDEEAFFVGEMDGVILYVSSTSITSFTSRETHDSMFATVPSLLLVVSLDILSLPHTIVFPGADQYC